MVTGDRWLHFTHVYKHVGTHGATNNVLAPEIARKDAAISTASKPLARRVLGNTAISPQLRLQLAHSLVFSVGLFSAAMWPRLLEREMARVHAVMVRVYRQILQKQKWRKQAVTDAHAETANNADENQSSQTNT